MDRLLSRAESSRSRVAFVQFSGDPYSATPEDRTALFQTILRPKVGALLLIDRPAGYNGHGASGSFRFDEQYGACLLRFAIDPSPPAAC